MEGLGEEGEGDSAQAKGPRQKRERKSAGKKENSLKTLMCVDPSLMQFQ
jgi:hypothetical protein